MKSVFPEMGDKSPFRHPWGIDYPPVAKRRGWRDKHPRATDQSLAASYPAMLRFGPQRGPRPDLLPYRAHRRSALWVPPQALCQRPCFLRETVIHSLQNAPAQRIALPGLCRLALLPWPAPPPQLRPMGHRRWVWHGLLLVMPWTSWPAKACFQPPHASQPDAPVLPHSGHRADLPMPHPRPWQFAIPALISGLLRRHPTRYRRQP